MSYIKIEYLLNPCGTLSIPYWKNKIINISSNIAIIQHSKFENQYTNYKRYFRLIHNLEDIQKSQYQAQTINIDKDKNQLVQMINTCYNEQNISVSEADILKWINHPTYNQKLWIKIEENGKIVTSGIAEYDVGLKEGILEWIQVLPEYQNKGYGKSIVNSILIELKQLGAKFVTVSGNLDNTSNPEKLYRSCGFTGEDIWYICET